MSLAFDPIVRRRFHDESQVSVLCRSALAALPEVRLLAAAAGGATASAVLRNS
jgi:hypothetical protein